MSEKTVEMKTGLPMITIAHVVIELIIIGGMGYYFNKRISQVEAQNLLLVEKIKELEECNNTGVSPDIMNNFKQINEVNTEVNKYLSEMREHIKQLYGAVREVQKHQRRGGGEIVGKMPTIVEETSVKTSIPINSSSTSTLGSSSNLSSSSSSVSLGSTSSLHSSITAPNISFTSNMQPLDSFEPNDEEHNYSKEDLDKELSEMSINNNVTPLENVPPQRK